MQRISKRFRALINEIGQCDTLVDIGSDHGKLGAYLIQENRVKNVISTDKRESCIKNMKNIKKELTLDDRFVIRLGNGFECIKKHENDTVVIAGMGANEIIRILSKREFDFDRYIFSPHQDISILREYLASNNFDILKDYVIKSNGKFYDIITCVNVENNTNLTKKEILYGKNDIKNQDFVQFIAQEIERLNNLLDKNVSCEKRKIIIEQLNIAKEILGEE